MWPPPEIRKPSKIFYFIGAVIGAIFLFLGHMTIYQWGPNIIRGLYNDGGKVWYVVTFNHEGGRKFQASYRNPEMEDLTLDQCERLKDDFREIVIEVEMKSSTSGHLFSIEKIECVRSLGDPLKVE